MTAVARRLAGASAVITFAGMVATPLLPQRGTGRRRLSSLVVGGIFATTTANASARWSPARAGAAAGVVAVATGVVERIGTATGLPFGRYAYTGALTPQVARVPVIVPLAWFGMSLPAREAAHATLGDRSTPAGRIVLGSAAMTAWDLFLDPQMVGEGFWGWTRRGVYRGIPLSNFVGWFATGLAIMAVLERMLPPDEPSPETARNRPGTERAVPGGAQDADPGLVGEYVYMSVMQTLGFARFFGDRLVAAVGGAGMLPIAAAATVRLVTDRSRR
ncbi:MAG: carotenoid biosynthesis protein [Actinomycetota bacterium]